MPWTARSSKSVPSHTIFTNHSILRTHTKAKAAVPELIAWSYKCEKYSFLSLGTLVSLSLRQYTEFCRHKSQRYFHFGFDYCGYVALFFRVCKTAWETQEIFKTFSLKMTWGQHRILSGFSLFIRRGTSVEQGEANVGPQVVKTNALRKNDQRKTMT
jgi:hypothetical protein